MTSQEIKLQYLRYNSLHITIWQLILADIKYWFDNMFYNIKSGTEIVTDNNANQKTRGLLFITDVHMEYCEIEGYYDEPWIKFYEVTDSTFTRVIELKPQNKPQNKSIKEEFFDINAYIKALEVGVKRSHYRPLGVKMEAELETRKNDLKSFINLHPEYGI